MNQEQVSLSVCGLFDFAARWHVTAWGCCCGFGTNVSCWESNKHASAHSHGMLTFALHLG